jgi:CHAD domain-containing protein
MSAHKTIYEYYLHQNRNIEHYLELCMSHPEADLVHELRLSIKKLRAFHILAEELSANDLADHIHLKHRVRQLYKAAGQLRDTQVQMHYLATFEEQTSMEYPEFSKWLSRREKKKISRFAKKPKQGVPHTTAQYTFRKIGNLLEQSGDKAILNGAEKVMTDLLSKARKLASGNMNAQGLHCIRTVTKQIRYILSILHESYPDFEFAEVTVESLREIEVAAGNWHDNLVRVEFLKKCVEKNHFNDDTEKLKYQELLAVFSAELDTAYSEASGIVIKALCVPN